MVFLLIGLIMVSSVSVYPSYADTLRFVQRWLLDEPSNSYYLFKHMKDLLVALFLCFVVSRVPYQIFEKFVYPILGLSIFGLVLVLFIGAELNGAKWWITLPGLPNIQPMEFAKVGFIMFSAYFFKKREHKMGSFSQGFVPYMFYLFVFIGLLALQPDFWGILLFGPLALVLYFLSWGRLRYIMGLVAMWLVFVMSIYAIGSSQESGLYYIHKRIANYLSDSRDAIANQTIGYQTEQALITIGSGGFGGRWFGESIQKFGYLPEVENDFIFSVIVEEWWLFGATILFGLYLALIYRLLRIASRTMDPFGRYIVLWVAAWIGLQAFTNMWVNLNVIPLTGVTLPFLSIGGSSIASLMIGIGLCLNISKYQTRKQNILHTNRKRFELYPEKVFEDDIVR